MGRIRIFYLYALVLLLGGCRSKPVEQQEQVSLRIYGEVAYLQRIALPEGAWLEVKLLQKMTNSSWQELSTTIIEKPKAVPIQYELTLRQPLSLTREYQLVATIYVGSNVWLSNSNNPYSLDATQSRHNLILPGSS